VEVGLTIPLVTLRPGADLQGGEGIPPTYLGQTGEPNADLLACYLR